MSNPFTKLHKKSNDFIRVACALLVFAVISFGIAYGELIQMTYSKDPSFNILFWWLVGGIASWVIARIVAHVIYGAGKKE